MEAQLDRLQRGEIDRDAFLEELARLPYRELPDVRLDTHRALRQGAPEVVLAMGKTPRQLGDIARSVRESGGNLLMTRVSREQAEEVRADLPELEYHESARLLVLRQEPIQSVGRGPIAVITAGTSDIPVAEEAGLTAELLGHKVERVFDVGVAGLHRLLAQIDTLRDANVLVVVAGMEGALPSVVAGLVARPVIAVPTSIGYGAAFEGMTALLGMLNSCASNVCVVNIDNGFGAGFLATLMNRE